MKLIVLIICCLFSNLALCQLSIESLGLENKDVTSLMVNYGILAVGTEGNGVYWQNSSSPSDTGWNNIVLDSTTIYAVYPHKSGPLGWAIGAGAEPFTGISDFVNCSFVGTPFQPIGQGISDSLTTAIFELDGYSDPTICGETYAAGGKALYLRGFTDTTWTVIYQTGIEGNITTVKVHEAYPGVVLAGGAEGFTGFLLIKSLDFGNTWTHISPPATVFDVDFSGDSAQTIFTANYSTAYKSMNAGNSWNLVFDGQGWYYITEVYYNQNSSRVYIGGGDGLDSTSAILFFSSDTGNTWHLIQLPMAGPIVDLDGDSGWIYFATPHNGIFRFQESLLVGINEHKKVIPPSSITLYQNYPNPFNSNTIIEFSIPRFPMKSGKTEFITLKIYNMLGQEVATLVSEKLTPGNYKYVWDASDFASGVYYYKIEDGKGFVQTKKLLLIK